MTSITIRCFMTDLLRGSNCLVLPQSRVRIWPSADRERGSRSQENIGRMHRTPRCFGANQTVPSTRGAAGRAACAGFFESSGKHCTNRAALVSSDYSWICRVTNLPAGTRSGGST
jgi:hypothetical protein